MPTSPTSETVLQDFRTAVARFAAVAPLVLPGGQAQAEAAARAGRIERGIELALDCGNGCAAFTPHDLDTLGYVTQRLGTVLGLAAAAAAGTGDSDRGFDEHAFAANLAGADPKALRVAAELVTLDTGGLDDCVLARRVEVLAGISADVAPRLLALAKALIVIGAVVLQTRDRLIPRRFRLLLDDLRAIGDRGTLFATLLGIEILQHCSPRSFTVAAGERATVRFEGEFPAADGVVEITDRRGALQTVSFARDTSTPILGPTTISLHYKSPRGSGAAGVSVTRQRVF